MRVKTNPDRNLVDKIRTAMKENGGYCPCRVERTEDTKCMCKEFREQLDNPDFEGYCHCQLYYKSKE